MPPVIDTTEAALWAAVGERPDDQLRRGVLADWYDDHAGTVVCVRCVNWMEGGESCPGCRGAGYISNGNAEMAEALRATADRVPRYIDWALDGQDFCAWWWWCCMKTPTTFNELCNIDYCLLTHLDGEAPQSPIQKPIWRHYPTATDAIRDLCRAWIKVHRGIG